MATPPNDDTKLMFKLLADGNWHNYYEVRDAIASAVPPGRALRKYQDRVAAVRRKRGDDYDTGATEDDRIYFGARACGQIVLTSWRNRGIEIAGTEENKRVRVRPGFKTWGIESLPDDPVEPEGGEVVPEVPPGDSEPSEVNGGGPEPVRGLTASELADLKVREQQFLDLIQEAALAEENLRPAPSQPVTMADLPHCDACGLGIVDQVKHEAWHLAASERKGGEDMALFSESEVRHLIEGIIAKQLDGFQQGMQRYLSVQFAQLEGTVAALAGLPWRAHR